MAICLHTYKLYGNNPQIFKHDKMPFSMNYLISSRVLICRMLVIISYPYMQLLPDNYLLTLNKKFFIQLFLSNDLAKMKWGLTMSVRAWLNQKTINLLDFVLLTAVCCNLATCIIVFFHVCKYSLRTCAYLLYQFVYCKVAIRTVVQPTSLACHAEVPAKYCSSST